MPLRPYTTDPPAGDPLEFLTNSDKTFGAQWNTTDGSGVPVTSAVCTLEFDVPLPIDGEEPPEPTRLVIDGYDPASTVGFIDTTWLINGGVMVTIRHTAWAEIVERSGNFDLKAISSTGRTLVLRRSIFTVRDGIS